MKITTIGIDLAKTVLQVHGVDKHGKAGLKKQLKRKDVSLRRLIITSPVAYATSPDCIRLTPARSIRSHAAVSEPCVSIARHASSITIAANPSLRASSAVHATQKSVASPQT